MSPLLIVFAMAGLVLVIALWVRLTALRREAWIRQAELPKGLFERLRKRHPHLTLKDCQLVAQGLRQFFLACLKSGRRFVAMPSQVADDLWHEFILCTRSYDAFCRKAFGRFLHHTPAVVLGDDKVKNAGLRRCWLHACREENIDPRAPTRLPLLFALDAKLQVDGGFRYLPDCDGVRRDTRGDGGSTAYCGSDFSRGDGDGATDGFDDGASDGGSDGGGCGGD
ncbi:glycine-rich domain-containing protein [Methyloversatilis thermotolerans]|uniref:glycine-rich domain-containing protein n=1 Tax=Methyloversatilis thermotolerans TaxID=1346290 RepID=UPI0003827739|nr:hypothetical protein [Methyloversatilis thermotolerans]